MIFINKISLLLFQYPNIITVSLKCSTESPRIVLSQLITDSQKSLTLVQWYSECSRDSLFSLQKLQSGVSISFILNNIFLV